MKNNVLYINTCADRLQIAVASQSGVSKFVGEPSAKKHNSELLSRIDALMAERGLTVGDLDFIAVAVGPGSFTGIRIGVATALAMARATKARTIGVSTLEIARNGNDKTAALPCGHGEYYTLSDGVYGTMTEEELFASGNVIFVGDDTLDSFISVADDKISKGESGLDVKPFYLKKSSAEREKEKND